MNNKFNNCLVYVRPWSKQQFEFLAQKAFSDFTKFYVSEFHKFDEVGYVNEFENNCKRNFTSKRCKKLTELNFDDIIKRDRVLRKINIDLAYNYIESCYSAISNVLEKVSPSVIITTNVDNYFLHILAILSRKRNILHCSCVSTFLSGYFRITTFGQSQYHRRSSSLEISNATKKLLRKDYKPHSFFVKLSANRYQIYATYARRRLFCLIKALYFNISYKLPKRRYNIHFLGSYIFYRNALSGPITVKESDNWIPKLNEINPQKVYIPLQWVPESTIDYWCEYNDILDYEQYVFTLVERNPNINFFVKEHPDFQGYRAGSFYQKLSKYKNAIVLPTHLERKFILKHFDFIFTYTGSAGFEFLLNRKMMLSPCKPFYCDDASFVKITEHKIPREIFHHKLPGKKLDKLVQYLLDRLWQGHFQNNKSWNLKNPLHRSNSENMANSLKEIYNMHYNE